MKRALSFRSSNASGYRSTPAGFPFCVSTMGSPVSLALRSQSAAWALKSLIGTRISGTRKAFILGLLRTEYGPNDDPPHPDPGDQVRTKEDLSYQRLSSPLFVMAHAMLRVNNPAELDAC